MRHTRSGDEIKVFGVDWSTPIVAVVRHLTTLPPKIEDYRPAVFLIKGDFADGENYVVLIKTQAGDQIERFDMFGKNDRFSLLNCDIDFSSEFEKNELKEKVDYIIWLGYNHKEVVEFFGKEFMAKQNWVIDVTDFSWEFKAAGKIIPFGWYLASVRSNDKTHQKEKELLNRFWPNVLIHSQYIPENEHLH